MKINTRTAALVMLLGLLITSCAHYKTTLTDAQGLTITCEASGKNGLITGHMLRNTFNQCVDNAKANGYTEGGGPSPDLEAKLRTLKEAYENGLITQEEYVAKRQAVLARF